MKTKKITLMMLALTFTTIVFATEVPKMNVVTLNETKTYITAVTSPHFASEISVLNAAGEIYYYKRSKAAPQFCTILNLSQLEDGTYTILLKTGKISTQRELQVCKGKVWTERLRQEMTPVYSYKDGMVRINYLNSNKNNVSLFVYKNNQLLQKSRLGSEFNIQRAFDISKQVHGELEFILTGSDKNYTYKISR